MLKKVHESFGWRVALTLVTVVASGIFSWLYRNVQGPLEGSVSLLQMENSDSGYIVGRAVVWGLIPQVIGAIVILVMLVIWIPPVAHALKSLWTSSEDGE